MQISQLHDTLREHIRARIQQGEVTGTALAGLAGVQQPQLSNFLHARRRLSDESFDRLLAAMGLSILDLLPAEELRSWSRPGAGDDPLFEQVPIVSAAHVAFPELAPQHVRAMTPFRRSYLATFRVSPLEDRLAWQRFVAIKADSHSGSAMAPVLSPGAVLLIDRHDNVLQAPRLPKRNLYAIRWHKGCLIRYADYIGNSLVLLPHNRAHATELIELQPGTSHSEYVIGRVCHIAREL